MNRERTLQVLSHMVSVYIDNFGMDDNESYNIALKDLKIDSKSEEEKIARYIWDHKDQSLDEVYSIVRHLRLNWLLRSS
jgi:hypothetical protein